MLDSKKKEKNFPSSQLDFPNPKAVVQDAFPGTLRSKQKQYLITNK